VGLLGSKRKTILIAQMLRGEGIPEERIRAVHAPVGLDLGGRTPAEIALSVLAELSLERYGGSGRPLRLSDELFERTLGTKKREELGRPTRTRSSAANGSISSSCQCHSSTPSSPAIAPAPAGSPLI